MRKEIDVDGLYGRRERRSGGAGAGRERVTARGNEGEMSGRPANPLKLEV